MYLSRGHPLLDRFNILIRRFIESGLVKKYWSQLNFEVYLRNMTAPKAGYEVRSDIYFVFSLFHQSGVRGSGIRIFVECFSVSG
jgi:hypothetical protein